MKIAHIVLIFLSVLACFIHADFGTKCSCGLTLILFCPGVIQCTETCKDYSGMSICVINEADGNHYCECMGTKKSLTFLN